ncbi:MAG TPA: glycerol kinase GlpK [Vicinamibacterales bacterium]|nr:glycerol kinase GlpK [Vicinamibacterales bacterium]
MAALLGAIDQGTSSTRFIVFDDSSRIVAASQMEHAQIYPRPGWVEHDPLEIWRNTETVIADAMRTAQLRPRDLAAIGITNQRETTVVWDRRSGAPLSNALVWQDTRVADDLPRYVEKPGVEFFRSRTGLPLSSYFSGLKLRWILDHVPGARTLAERGDALFGNIDTFLVWHLTGGPHGGLHVTDVTNASRTQLMHLQTLDWAPDLLEAFDIPRAMLPSIRSSSEHYGTATPEPIRGVSIGGILGDQQAALVGQACFRPGEAKNTYGTGCFLLMNTGETAVQSQAGLLTTVAYQIGRERPRYALEGSVAVTGALVQWLRDNLGLIASSAEVEALARSVPDNGGAYFVPAFSGLYAPHWNDRARGVVAGLTRFVTRGHLARAVLEATAFQTWEVLQAMEKDSGVKLEALRVDGGMTDNGLLMQFQADLVDRVVVRPAVKETTALGAAFAAGLAAGVFRDVDDLRARWVESHRWTPAMADADRTRLVRDWTKAVQRSLDWLDP